MKKFLDTCRRLLSIALNLFVLCAEPIALPLSWGDFDTNIKIE